MIEFVLGKGGEDEGGNGSSRSCLAFFPAR
jgi:hypothetical protein